MRTHRSIPASSTPAGSPAQAAPTPPTGPDLAASEPTLEHLDRLTRSVGALRAELEHAQRLASLGTLASIIAHEFNNILTPIISYAQMALDHPEDHALASKAIRRALDGGTRAAQITDAVLAFSRPESKVPHGTSTPAIADVNAALDSALSCLARNLAGDNVHLERALPTGLSAAIRPVALSQVLLNLILNARNAMTPGGGQLRVSAIESEVGHRPTLPAGARSSAECSTWNNFVVDPIGAESRYNTLDNSYGDYPAFSKNRQSERGWVRVVVEDSGRGIRAEDMARIFEPFVTMSAKVGRTGSSATGGTSGGGGGPRGTGLGLAMSHRLVEDVGGEIWVESELGKGSRFTIVLPGA